MNITLLKGKRIYLLLFHHDSYFNVCIWFVQFAIESIKEQYNLFMTCYETFSWQLSLGWWQNFHSFLNKKQIFSGSFFALMIDVSRFVKQHTIDFYEIFVIFFMKMFDDFSLLFFVFSFFICYHIDNNQRD